MNAIFENDKTVAKIVRTTSGLCDPRPVPTIFGASFQARDLGQVADWIVAQNFGALLGWKVKDWKELEHDEFDSSWLGEIALESPKGNVWTVVCSVRWAVPRVRKTFDQMTPDEKIDKLKNVLTFEGYKF